MEIFFELSFGMLRLGPLAPFKSYVYKELSISHIESITYSLMPDYAAFRPAVGNLRPSEEESRKPKFPSISILPIRDNSTALRAAFFTQWNERFAKKSGAEGVDKKIRAVQSGSIDPAGREIVHAEESLIFWLR